jgi:hypothetical protein
VLGDVYQLVVCITEAVAALLKFAITTVLSCIFETF